MKEKKTIGSVLASFRILKKITQKQMSIDLRTSLKNIQALENIESVDDLKENIDLVRKSADYFDIPLSTIIFNTISIDKIENPKQKKFYEAARPVIDALVYYLLGVTQPTNEVKPNLEERSEN